MKTRSWLVGWTSLVLIGLIYIVVRVVDVDPYFHYHAPKTDKYYYYLDNQRSQNDGIIRFFDYDAIITGTSMTENFRTSEFDETFGVHSIKVPFEGASFKEINDNLRKALISNPNCKTVIRCLDYEMLLWDKDKIRDDLGEYPEYLYDSNIFNDVKYIFNKDVIFSRVYDMIYNSKQDGFEPGILSFDDYSFWGYLFPYGRKVALPEGTQFEESDIEIHLTDEEIERTKANVIQNVTSLAEEFPNVDFYYFFPPYSGVYWYMMKAKGAINYHLEAERVGIELMLEEPNIHLFTFNYGVDMITDLNNYKDYIHYGPWVNTMVIRGMKNDMGRITKENYQDYLDNELVVYSNFDYSLLENQEDYEDDFLASEILIGQ